jgi:hypothetical protein
MYSYFWGHSITYKMICSKSSKQRLKVMALEVQFARKGGLFIEGRESRLVSLHGREGRRS